MSCVQYLEKPWDSPLLIQNVFPEEIHLIAVENVFLIYFYAFRKLM